MEVSMKSIKSITAAALFAAAAFTPAAGPALAHHSAAMFDDEKVMEVRGTVKELQWKSPHIWLQVIVDENGTKKEWSLEGGSPNSLSRAGWKATSFKPGDVVTVRFNPMRDGSAAGNFIGARFASDGKTIGRWQ
jgi:hypothetical protein